MALGVSVGCRTSEHEIGSFLIETGCLLSFSLHRPVRVQSTRDTVGLDALVVDRKGTIFRPVLEKGLSWCLSNSGPNSPSSVLWHEFWNVEMDPPRCIQALEEPRGVNLTRIKPTNAWTDVGQDGDVARASLAADRGQTVSFRAFKTKV